MVQQTGETVPRVQRLYCAHGHSRFDHTEIKTARASCLCSLCVCKLAMVHAPAEFSQCLANVLYRWRTCTVLAPIFISNLMMAVCALRMFFFQTYLIRLWHWTHRHPAFRSHVLAVAGLSTTALIWITEYSPQQLMERISDPKVTDSVRGMTLGCEEDLESWSVKAHSVEKSAVVSGSRYLRVF